MPSAKRRSFAHNQFTSCDPPFRPRDWVWLRLLRQTSRDTSIEIYLSRVQNAGATSAQCTVGRLHRQNYPRARHYFGTRHQHFSVLCVMVVNQANRAATRQFNQINT